MAPITSTAFAERLGMIVGVALVLCFMFTTAAPYFLTINQTSVRLIDQQQTILQSVFLVLVGYLWGNSAGNKTKDRIIELQAKTAQTAGAALNPIGGDGVTLAPGDTATVDVKETGETNIQRDPPA